MVRRPEYDTGGGARLTVSEQDTKHWNPHPNPDSQDGPEGASPDDSDTIFLPEPRAEGSSRSASGPGTLWDVQLSVSEERRSSARPGELLDGTRYRILRWLGDGGMGTVFEALHEDLERSVALKVLRGVDNEKHLGLFRQEAKTLAKLGSRYVVDVHDFIELSDGRLAIAMELLRGETLRDALREGPLPLERVIPILRQISKGLEIAHGAGVIHRDIKPENISLESWEGRADAVKLLDFGIAQVAGRTAGPESRAGTPGYLAPEVVSGVGVDRRSDLYALGCVAYELVTGRRPFEDDEPSKVLLAQLGTKPPRPSTFEPVPAAFERVVMKCLRKAPEERFATAADLEAALCEAQIELGLITAWDDLPLPEVEPRVRERLLRRMPSPEAPPRRSRWWVAAGATFVGLVALGGVWMASRSAEPVSAEAQWMQEVDQLSAEARAAAARAFFVYPPPEQPDAATAFSVVLRMESFRSEGDGDGAEEAASRAASLRTEFADTLERLGDRYWNAEGGKPFALDYYAEALVFDPARARAKVRAVMTPGELRMLRDKAQTREFSDSELVAVEPLIALADVSDSERERRLVRIESASPRPAQRRAQLARLSRPRPGQPPEPLSKASPSSPEPEPQLEPPPLDVGVERELAAGSDPEQSGDQPNPAEARRLTRQADRAHARGDSAHAERLYSAALGAHRKHADAYRGLGRVAFDRGSYALAARRLKKAVALSPRAAALRIELGDALFKTFDYPGARAQYLRAQELGSASASGRLKKVDDKRR